MKTTYSGMVSVLFKGQSLFPVVAKDSIILRYMSSFLLTFLALHTIFLKLMKYPYFHNHSINIFTIFICLSKLPGPISNKYVNSSL